MEDATNYEVNKNYGQDATTGEGLERASKAKASWGVRLDEETIKELDKVAEIIGVHGDKRAVLEHLLKVRKTAELKGQTKGKLDTIEHVERALDLIREEMNTLLRHNLNKEEEIREVVNSEIEELEQKIKSLQDKLNDQLSSNKEIREENKSLKATITDKDKEIQELNERYADTNKLIARLEQDEVKTQEKLAEFEELKLAHKELQTTTASIEKELTNARAEAVKLTAELSTAKQSNADKDKQIQALTDANTKDIAQLKSMHVLEIEKAVLEKEKEMRDKIDILRDKNDSIEKEKQSLEKEFVAIKETFDTTVSELNEEHEKEINKLKAELEKIYS